MAQDRNRSDRGRNAPRNQSRQGSDNRDKSNNPRGGREDSSDRDQ